MHLTLWLVVVSGALHALWNAVLKRQSTPQLAIFVVGGSATMTAALLACMLPGEVCPHNGALLWALTAGIFEGIYFVSLAKAVSRAPLALAYTVTRGGAVLLAWPLSVALLGEIFTRRALAGTTLVLTGMLIIVVGQAGLEELRTWTKRGNNRTAYDGLGWALLSALAVAGYSLSYKFALLKAATPLATTAIAFGIGTGLTALALGPSKLRSLARMSRRETQWQLFAGVVATFSFALFLEALRTGGTAAILTLRNISLLFGQALAWRLDERVRLRQLLGVCLILSGSLVIEPAPH